MDKETYGVLAKVRLERAGELVEEAQELLKMDGISQQIIELFMQWKRL